MLEGVNEIINWDKEDPSVLMSDEDMEALLIGWALNHLMDEGKRLKREEFLDKKGIISRFNREYFHSCLDAGLAINFMVTATVVSA